MHSLASTLDAGSPSGDELARTDMVQLPSGDGGSSLARDEKHIIYISTNASRAMLGILRDLIMLTNTPSSHGDNSFKMFLSPLDAVATSASPKSAAQKALRARAARADQTAPRRLPTRLDLESASLRSCARARTATWDATLP